MIFDSYICLVWEDFFDRNEFLVLLFTRFSEKVQHIGEQNLAANQISGHN